jgi:hypothetical protein
VLPKEQKYFVLFLSFQAGSQGRKSPCHIKEGSLKQRFFFLKLQLILNRTTHRVTISIDQTNHTRRG